MYKRQDGDGIPDNSEGTDDTDGDGVPNYLDIDSDNDGLLDSDEVGSVDAFLDTDGDGVPNLLDLDSDNDGLTDAFEAGGSDANGDGEIDNFVDSNGDGHDDGVGVAPLPADDTDGDTVVDHLDVDSDNDGLPDVFESLGSGVDNDGDGQIDNIVDANNDGLADGVSINSTLDTDNDDSFNHLDLDSDGDSIVDLVEAGSEDFDGDGQVDAWADADGDGVPDSVDVDVVGGTDSDGDSIVDIADAEFTGLSDFDGDGVIDDFDNSPFGDGFVPLTETPVTDAVLPDTNGNDIPDVLESSDVELGSAVVQTGLSGGGCSINGPSEKRDPLMMLLMMISSIWILGTRRARRRLKAKD